MPRPLCLLVETPSGVVAFGPYKTAAQAVAAREAAEARGKKASAAPLLDPANAPGQQPPRPVRRAAR
jgi:hypothetical protein